MIAENRRRDPFLKIAAEFLALVIALGICAIFMQHKIFALLNATMEQNVARQTESMAVLAESQFRQELMVLHNSMKFLEAHPGAEDEMIAGLAQARGGAAVGILSVDGKRSHGNTLPVSDFHHLPQAILGHDVVDYAEGQGLLFAVPLRSGDAVRGVLWRRYSGAQAAQLFNLAEYHADRQFLLASQDGDIIIPYRNYNEEDAAFFADPSVSSAYEEIRGRLASAPAAAVYTESRKGRVFLFGADLPETNCTLMGFVPWETVAGGIARIYTLVLRAGAILLLLIALTSVYLFIVQAKAEESDSLRREKEFSDRASQA
ncbi:MAG: hypothetical protein IJ812_06890, partial [Schwartzia sp.]|nr:hypothetical protein [Schwartzia sp. (in: firmicutes)]